MVSFGKFPRMSPRWRASLVWFAWSVIGGLLPLWGTALLFELFSHPVVLYDFLKNGEFVLYSASFIGGSMYTLRKDVFPLKNLLNIVFVLLLAVSLLVFVAISVVGLVGVNKTLPIQLSSGFLTKLSILVFCLTTVVCFLVTLAEAGGAGVDVPDAMKRDSKSLDRRFADLLREQGDN